jgi:hypothetical protein
VLTFQTVEDCDPYRSPIYHVLLGRRGEPEPRLGIERIICGFRNYRNRTMLGKRLYNGFCDVNPISRDVPGISQLSCRFVTTSGDRLDLVRMCVPVIGWKAGGAFERELTSRVRTATSPCSAAFPCGPPEIIIDRISYRIQRRIPLLPHLGMRLG